MTMTPIRTGTHHRCALPTFMYGDHDTGDVIRCDDCGKYWKAYSRRWGEGEWYRISRLVSWWISRRAKPVPPEGDAQ
jgi:hypothetical protein